MNYVQNLARESLVIVHAGCSHQGRICCETADERIGMEFQDLGLIGSVGKELHLQIR